MDLNFSSLRKFNIFMGVLHLVQFFIMFFLSKERLQTVYLYLPKPDTASRSFTLVQEKFFEINLGQTISYFLLISAVAHLILLIPTVYNWYKENLSKEINLIRWYEYALSSSLMVFVIAILCGINDGAILLGIFALNACMNLFGAMMEKQNSLLKEYSSRFELITIKDDLHGKTELTDEIKSDYKTDWTSFIYGCFAGIIPWIIMGVYFFTAIRRTNDFIKIPDFVYWIYPTLFVFFNLFAINMALQYFGVWKWKKYIFGEKAYIVLSLVAKSVLAWLIWGGTLRP
jgi:Heliorhodopsin